MSQFSPFSKEELLPQAEMLEVKKKKGLIEFAIVLRILLFFVCSDKKVVVKVNKNTFPFV